MSLPFFLSSDPYVPWYFTISLLRLLTGCIQAQQLSDSIFIVKPGKGLTSYWGMSVNSGEGLAITL